MPPAVDFFRYLGIVFELWGLYLLARDIRERRIETDQPTIGEWLAALARRGADHLRRRNVSASASLSGEGKLTAVGSSLDTRWNVEAKTVSTEERIAALEKRMRRMEERASNVESELHKETEERRAGDDAERQAREATDETVRQLVVQLTAGNLNRERAGVFLFVVGLLLTNLSEEIGGLF